MNISLEEIKVILKDKTYLKNILIKKRAELKNRQEVLVALGNFINDEDLEKFYISVDYDFVADAIKNAFPGFYGYFF